MAVKKKKSEVKKKTSVKKTSKKKISAAVPAEHDEMNAVVALQEEILYSQTEKPDDSVEVCSEKLTYANIMEKGVQFSVIFLAVTLLLYMTGWLPSATAPDQIPQYWNLRADDYLKATGSPKGWEWFQGLQFSDNLIMVGVVGMAFLSMVGYFVLADAYWRKKWYIFFTIVMVEIAVILFASTGIISGGGH